MRKWYFSLKAEAVLAKNAQTLKYLFDQVSSADFGLNEKVD